MTFEVNGCYLKLTDGPIGPLTSGSSKVNSVNFSFDSRWNGLLKYAAFLFNGNRISRLITDGSVVIPDDVFNEPGTLRIGAFGLEDGSIFTTMWSEPIEIWPGAYAEEVSST